MLSKAYVSCMMMNVFESHPLGWDSCHDPKRQDWTDMSDRILAKKYGEEHQFFTYAAAYWAEHAREAKFKEDSPSSDLILAICDQ